NLHFQWPVSYILAWPFTTNDMEQKEKSQELEQISKIESLERKIDLLVNKIETLEGNNRKNK
ncbi:MAG: hypothetical protein ACTIDC_06800, partial [Lactococcus lactis]